MITALCLLLSAVMATTPMPSEALTARMILVEVAQHGEGHPSARRTDAGQCKRFQINSFAEASVGYMLPGFPEQILYLPSEHADPDVSGRPVGTCWDMPAVETGNAFVEVARFDYDSSLSEQENLVNAKAFLMQVQAGDMMQMLASYSSGGRGTHTLMFTRPYDPRVDALYWADSNFANRIIDGVKYGYVRAYQSWPFDEVAGWLTAAWHNGATIYRLREDITGR